MIMSKARQDKCFANQEQRQARALETKMEIAAKKIDVTAKNNKTNFKNEFTRARVQKYSDHVQEKIKKTISKRLNRENQLTKPNYPMVKLKQSQTCPNSSFKVPPPISTKKAFTAVLTTQNFKRNEGATRRRVVAKYSQVHDSRSDTCNQKEPIQNGDLPEANANSSLIGETHKVDFARAVDKNGDLVNGRDYISARTAEELIYHTTKSIENCDFNSLIYCDPQQKTNPHRCPDNSGDRTGVPIENVDLTVDPTCTYKSNIDAPYVNGDLDLNRPHQNDEFSYHSHELKKEDLPHTYYMQERLNGLYDLLHHPRVKSNSSTNRKLMAVMSQRAGVHECDVMESAETCQGNVTSMKPLSTELKSLSLLKQRLDLDKVKFSSQEALQLVKQFHLLDYWIRYRQRLRHMGWGGPNYPMSSSEDSQTAFSSIIARVENMNYNQIVCPSFHVATPRLHLPSLFDKPGPQDFDSSVCTCSGEVRTKNEFTWELETRSRYVESEESNETDLVRSLECPDRQFSTGSGYFESFLDLRTFATKYKFHLRPDMGISLVIVFLFLCVQYLFLSDW